MCEPNELSALIKIIRTMRFTSMSTNYIEGRRVAYEELSSA